MKLHNIFWSICVLGGTLALSSCEKYDELFPEKYHCVLNIKDSGIRNVELSATNAEETVLVSVMKTGSKGEAQAGGIVSPMPEKAFQEYCTTNRLNYDYLPAEYYSLQNNEMQFSSQDRYKLVNAVLKTKGILQLQESHKGKSYALPLLLHSSEVPVNDSLLIIVPDIRTSGGGKAKAFHTNE